MCKTIQKWYARSERYIALQKISQVMDTHSHQFHSEEYQKYAMRAWKKMEQKQLIYLVNEVWELE